MTKLFLIFISFTFTACTTKKEYEVIIQNELNKCREKGAKFYLEGYSHGCIYEVNP